MEEWGKRFDEWEATSELIWDGDQLPIEAFAWEAGLEIEILRVFGRMPNWSGSEKLPSLRMLHVNDMQLTELDLSPVPRLTILECPPLDVRFS